MASEREIAEYLLDCFDTLYRVLGEGAPTLLNDAYVVRTYDAARAFGGVALELREFLGAPAVQSVDVLEGVLANSIASDETGAMTLFAMAMVVGPRLLVSLLDARQALGEGPLNAICEHASQVVVSEIRATGDAARDQAPIEDSSWQGAARDFTETLDGAGYVESMGISR